MNMLWTLTWNDGLPAGATILMLMSMFTGWLAIGFAVHRFLLRILFQRTHYHVYLLHENRAERVLSKLEGKSEQQVQDGIRREILVQRLLVHNGIAFYCTWTFVLSVVNVNVNFQYVGRFNADMCSIVCCSSLLLALIVWFMLENTLLDHYVRHIVVQYPGIATVRIHSILKVATDIEYQFVTLVIYFNN